MWTDAAGLQDVPAPEELTVQEIQGVMADFRQGVLNARDAGFDGVELHAANGYLLNQFLSTNTNQRNDAYGGSVERRARFVLELFDLVAQAWTNGRIGIRFSPGGGFNDIRDEESEPMYIYLARELSRRKPAYVHVVRPGAFVPAESQFDVPGLFRSEFTGTLMLNGGFTATEAEALLKSGSTDLVSFGRPFISTPNLPEVFRNGWQVAPANHETFYTPGAAGYTDYPPVDGVLEAAV
jgi:N-ethylmaleimide reductase